MVDGCSSLRCLVGPERHRIEHSESASAAAESDPFGAPSSSRGRDALPLRILRKAVSILTMPDILPFSEAKAHLSELAERVEHEHERILVTRNGRPSFVLISLDELEPLEETVDILRDPRLVESLARSRAEAADGELLPLPPA